MDKLNINITKFDAKGNSIEVMQFITNEPTNDIFPIDSFKHMGATYCDKNYPQVLITIEPMDKTVYPLTVIVSRFNSNCINTKVEVVNVKKIKG